MKRQISRISLGQTAKVVGAVHVVLALPILLLGIIWLLIRPTRITSEISPMWLLVSPFIYGFFAYTMALMMCLIYNFVARYLGGVEFTTSEKMVDEGRTEGRSESQFEPGTPPRNRLRQPDTHS